MAETIHFPPEILSSITQALDGFDIANLWLSGDVRLRVLLESGGVTRFTLALRQTRTRKWPKLLSRFKRLEYLSIGPRGNCPIWFRDVDLLSLPRTLKHLALDFENSELVLLGIPFVVADTNPDPKLSPPTDAEMVLAPLPMAEHFIELQNLILNGNFTLPHILVSHLPQTLLRLALPYSIINSDFIPSLPPHLTTLELPQLRELEEETIFPSNLTHLDLHRLNSMTSTLMSHIPASVIFLDLYSCDSSDLDLIHFLPPHLTSLSIDWGPCFNDDLRECLPRSLLHLTMNHYQAIKKLDSLPPGLQTFDNSGPIQVMEESIALLPSSLTKVSLWALNITSEGFKKFSAIRFLSMNFNFLAPKSPYGFMNTLEELFAPEVDPNALIFTPRLSKMNLASFTTYNDLTALKQLSHLRQLRIDKDIALDLPFALSLPQSLEELEIFAFNEVGPTVWQYLPRSLKCLSVHGNTTIGDLSIGYLPPQLIELNLDRACKLSDDAIRLLPRTLEILNLSFVELITDEGIRHLPPYLIACDLKRASLLTDTSAALFPRHMTRLALNSSKNFSNNAMAHFPRSLTTLYLSENDQINCACLPHIPPRLTIFTLKNNDLLLHLWSHKDIGSLTKLFFDSITEEKTYAGNNHQ